MKNGYRTFAAKLNRSLKSNNDLTKDEQTLHTLWQAIPVPAEPEPPSIESEWQAVQQRLAAAQAKTHKATLRLPRRWQLIPAVGMVLGLVIAAVVFLHDPSVTLSTGRGGSLQMALTDGSILWLNHTTRVRIEGDRQRTVVLQEGQAQFQVQPSEFPFQVITDQATITVLGTRFDVLTRNAKTRIVVQEGVVKVIPSRNEKGIELCADTRLLVQDALLRLQPEPVNAETLLGWIRGDLVFEKTPLHEIITELENRYDVEISIASPDLAYKTLTATFRDLAIDQVLRSISLTMGVDVVRTGNHFRLQSPSQSEDRS
jgi:transmembrane sensor